MESTRSLFLETVGESPATKVIDFFLGMRGFDYSKSQIARESGISRITIEPIWKKLIDGGMIKKTRTVGRAEMYKLDLENPKVRALIELDFKLSENFAVKQEATKMKVSVKTVR